MTQTAIRRLTRTALPTRAQAWRCRCFPRAPLAVAAPARRSPQAAQVAARCRALCQGRSAHRRQRPKDRGCPARRAWGCPGRGRRPAGSAAAAACGRPRRLSAARRGPAGSAGRHRPPGWRRSAEVRGPCTGHLPPTVRNPRPAPATMRTRGVLPPPTVPSTPPWPAPAVMGPRGALLPRGVGHGGLHPGCRGAHQHVHWALRNALASVRPHSVWDGVLWNCQPHPLCWWQPGHQQRRPRPHGY
mmetsp:Transcript_121431/g.338945  ORF Transcript_121431/g.338945 Transcript_121431/m.338945 type:complete len:244 (-) Transcript_121431:379-1110(-)